MALFKLHGSTSWYKNSQGEIQKHNLAQELPELDNTLIYPGRTKIETLDEPYQTSYQYLAACLRRAEVLLVIGYAFGDLSIQRTVQSALADGAKFKVVIINGEQFSPESVPFLETLGSRVSVIGEDYSPVPESGLPFYASQLRGHLGLGPLVRYLGSDAPTDEFGPLKWVNVSIEAHVRQELQAIGYRYQGEVVSVEPGQESNFVLLLQTKNRTAFERPINLRKGVQQFHLGLPMGTPASRVLIKVGTPPIWIGARVTD